MSHTLYLIHPDGRVERSCPADDGAARAWVGATLGHAYRMHPHAHVVRAYMALYAAFPRDATPNVPASIALGVWGMWHALGPVLLSPTHVPDETFLCERLECAFRGDPAARREIGLTLTW